MDATSGTNDVNFLLFILLVFDDYKNGIQNCMGNHLPPNKRKFSITWLECLHAQAHRAQPEWKPNCFIVDDVPQEHQVFKYVP
jgi:hypothetical protein